jgi:hypothetical protein
VAATLSGSGLLRGRKCPPAYALAAVLEASSREAEVGMEVHRVLAAVARRDAAAVATEIAALTPEGRAFAERIEHAAVPEGEPEVAYAFDARTGRVRRLRVQGRDYPVEPGEIPGTADLVVPARGDEPLMVIDWKTARWDFDPALHYEQLEFYALCAAREAGALRVRCRIGVVAEGGAIGWHTWELGFDELAAVAARVRNTHARVEAARAERAAHERANAAPWTPDVRGGEHCRYCPALLHCPGKRAAIGAVLGMTPEALTAETAGRAHAIAKDAERVGERVREAVGQLVDAFGELPTGDGRVVRRDGKRALRLFPAHDDRAPTAPPPRVWARDAGRHAAARAADDDGEVAT